MARHRRGGKASSKKTRTSKRGKGKKVAKK